MALPPQHIAWDCSNPITIGGITYQLETSKALRGNEGCRLWPVGIALADYIDQSFNGKEADILGRVCDIGCGLGLVGMVASRFAVHTTLISECGTVVDQAKLNVKKHGCDVCVAHVNWADATFGFGFDSIFGSDIIYKPYNIPGLAAFIAKHWTGVGPCWFTNAIDSTYEEFKSALHSFRLACQKINLDYTLPNGIRFPYFRMEITR